MVATNNVHVAVGKSSGASPVHAWDVNVNGVAVWIGQWRPDLCAINVVDEQALPTTTVSGALQHKQQQLPAMRVHLLIVCTTSARQAVKLLLKSLRL